MRTFICILAMCLTFSVKAQEAIPLLSCPLKLPHQQEFQSFWNLSAEIQNEKEKIFDWTPKGESLSESKQGFTVQAYQLEESFRLKDVFQKFISTLQENVEPTDLLKYKVHQQTKRSIFFEWWIAPPYKDAQHEWIKMIQNKNNKLAMVRYVSKMNPRSEDESPWVECVEKAELDEQIEGVSDLDFLFIRAELNPQSDPLQDICIEADL